MAPPSSLCTTEPTVHPEQLLLYAQDRPRVDRLEHTWYMEYTWMVYILTANDGFIY